MGDYLDVSPGEEKTGGLLKDTNLADSLEAILGALYLDGGFVTVESFILEQWDFLLKNLSDYALVDVKSTLQEMGQMRYAVLPEYCLLRKEGEDHDPLFTVGVRLLPKDPFIEGQGRSKRLAEKAAAHKLLEIIQRELS